MSNAYKSAGVNIEAGEKFVTSIESLVARTTRAGVLGGLGGFGAMFRLKELCTNYVDPVIVSSTDGVGTKLCVAQEVNHHSTIGIDLVAMCVNDILAQGAEPLFFLDYFATGKLEQNVAVEILDGISSGCLLAGTALVGGETAEMPGMYTNGKYDLAGFAVGIVEYQDVLPKFSSIKSGDVLVGLLSSGLHSNGYSLVRKVFNDNKIDYNATATAINEKKSWKEVLLTPTRIYVKSVLSAIKFIKGIAHITGGGIIHNLPRCIPEHLSVKIEKTSWKIPDIFRMIQDTGNVSEHEMFSTFNCGIGMILVVDKDNLSEVMKSLSSECPVEIGHVCSTNGRNVIF